MQGLRPLKPPVSTPGSEAFWDAANNGTLLYGQCADCNEPHYYPRPHCPFCHGENVSWQAASGQGEIYAFSVLRRAKPPYAVAYVRLAEGPAMLTNVISESLDDLHIGMPVVLRFVPADGQAIPMFTPAAEASQ